MLENGGDKRSRSSWRYVRNKKLAVIDFYFGSFHLGETIQQPGNEGCGDTAFSAFFNVLGFVLLGCSMFILRHQNSLSINCCPITIPIIWRLPSNDLTV